MPELCQVHRERIEKAFAAAVAAAGDLGPSVEEFGDHLLACATRRQAAFPSAEAELEALLDDTVHADLYFALALLQRRPAAWMRFEERFHSFLKATALRLCRDARLAEELAASSAGDLLLDRKSPATSPLASYLGSGSFVNWLKLVVRNRLLDALRERRPEISLQATADDLGWSAHRAEPPAPGPSPEAELGTRQAAGVLLDCLPLALAALSPEDRLLLRLRHLQNVQLKELSAFTGKSVSQTCRQLQQLHGRLLGSLKQLASSRHGWTADEFQDLVDSAVTQNLEFELTTLL
jgi:RNA polymerase sigma-70 factor (ECF subfamily)